MTGNMLTLEELRGIGDEQAAALLIVRRNADDYAGQDETILDEWLAADPKASRSLGPRCHGLFVFRHC